MKYRDLRDFMKRRLDAFIGTLNVLGAFSR